MNQPFQLATDYAPMPIADRENLAKVLSEWRGIMHRRGWTAHRHIGTHQHNVVCFGDISDAEAAE